MFDSNNSFVTNARSSQRLPVNYQSHATNLNVSSNDDFDYPDLSQENMYLRRTSSLHSNGSRTSRPNDLRSSRYADNIHLDPLSQDSSYDSHTPSLSCYTQMDPMFDDSHQSLGEMLSSSSPSVIHMPYVTKTGYSSTPSNRSGLFQGNTLHVEPEYRADYALYHNHIPLTDATWYSYDRYPTSSTSLREGTNRLYEPRENLFEPCSRLRSRSQLSGMNESDSYRNYDEPSRLSYPVSDYETAYSYLPESVQSFEDPRVKQSFYSVNTKYDDPYIYSDRVEYPRDFNTYHPRYPVSSSPHYSSLTTTPHSIMTSESHSSWDRDPDQSWLSSFSISPRVQNVPSTPQNYGVRTPTNRVVDPYISLTRLFLWKQSPYKEIWEEHEFAQQLTSSPHPVCTHNSDPEWIHSQIEEAVAAKRECHFREARLIFIKLVVLYPSDPLIWLEFARLEMECGEYGNAHNILAASRIQIPHNEAILQKSLKVEERLFNLPATLRLVAELHKLDTQKSVKMMMDGVLVLARMGFEKSTYDYYLSVTNNPHFFTGNFYMDFLEFQLHSSKYESFLHMIPHALSRFPKYGPLWFFSLHVIQHKSFVEWHQNTTSIDTCEFDSIMTEALKCLTNDITWKVYYIRLQYTLRFLLAIHHNDAIRVSD